VETVRVDICYRPLRIGWAIKAGDMDAFRDAAKISFALWGGRFNPIIVVDQEERAQELIDVFRVDLILPLGDSQEVKDFPKKFPHLITPFHHNNVFVGDEANGVRCQVLDVHNALLSSEDMPEWKAAKEKGIRLYSWAPDDPLADVFLMHFGEYPSKDEIHIDYRGLLKQAGEAKEIAIDPAAPLTADLFGYPSVSFVSRLGIEPHYGVRGGWDTPGFFSGDANNFDDLVCCWNLRAADIPLLFVDVKHLERYGETVGSWGKVMREMVSQRRHEFERRLAVWLREEAVDRNDMAKGLADATNPFKAEEVSSVCTVGDGSWNGLNIRPATMCLDECSTLGVMGTEAGKPKVSFSLDNKPFSDDGWFHTQHGRILVIYRRPLRRRTAHFDTAILARTERVLCTHYAF
jgi:hypothetical protein